VMDSPSPPSLDLLDQLAEQAAQRLDRLGLARQSLPDAFALDAAWSGQRLQIHPRAWRGAASPLARVVRVDGGEAVQVLNIVLFPAHDHALPVFGCEILQFRRGLHLFVLDAFPLVEGAPDPCANALRAARAALYPALELSDEETPAWGEQVFSPEVMLIKPGARRALTIAPFIDAVLGLLDVWCDAARAASPASHPALIARRQTYLRQHGEEEPAGPFLTRIAGEQWVERFVFDFLYPRWLYQRDAQPEWLQPLKET
jgi:phycoerythrobilin:ferredoxin oxidoreductase